LLAAAVEQTLDTRVVAQVAWFTLPRNQLAQRLKL
jgi:hypothetical protein